MLGAESQTAVLDVCVVRVCTRADVKLSQLCRYYVRRERELKLSVCLSAGRGGARAETPHRAALHPPADEEYIRTRSNAQDTCPDAEQSRSRPLPSSPPSPPLPSQSSDYLYLSSSSLLSPRCTFHTAADMRGIASGGHVDLVGISLETHSTTGVC